MSNQHYHHTAPADTVRCDLCGKSFVPKRSDMRFCSAACRRRFHRREETARPAGVTVGEEIRELWHKFREGDTFGVLQQRLEEKRRKSVCSGCVWGMSGVCIRPDCRRLQSKGGMGWDIIHG